MKKIFAAFLILLLAVSLAACGNDEKASSDNKASTTVTATKTRQSPDSTFKNGVFKTKNYTLTIVKEQVVHDKQQDDIGLILWYTFKNTSKKTSVNPDDAIKNLSLTQNSDTSVIELDDTFDAEGALYPSLTDSDQIEKSNKMMDTEKLSDSAVLPGKTVKTFDAYELDNTTHDIIITAHDPQTSQKVGKYTIKIK